MIDSPEIIGKRLEKLRTVVGLNQTGMAEALHIGQSAWSQYESGTRRVTLEVAGRIAVRFGVTLDWLYRGDPSGLPLKLAQSLVS